jgi:uncharacterized membrane protein
MTADGAALGSHAAVSGHTAALISQDLQQLCTATLPGGWWSADCGSVIRGIVFVFDNSWHAGCAVISYSCGH